MSKSKVDTLIDHYKQVKSGRQNFETYWQTLHDYYYIESPDINSHYFAGNELEDNYIWDATSINSADVLASGFMNYLTPPTSKWFRLRHKDPMKQDNKSVENYLESVSEEVQHTLNGCNFYNEVISTYKGSGVYGTAILFAEEDIEEDVRFYNLPIKSCCIIDDGRGRIGEYYLTFEYTAWQALTRWGDKISDELQREAKERSTEKKHEFLLHIGKRYNRDVTKQDKKNMPIEAVWIDIEGKKIIEESGYNEMPAMAHRFDKRPFIPWGFSPAMKALPFVRLLNAIAKSNLRSMMKHNDPAIAAPENAFLMPFSSDPRAINYYNKKIVNSQNDIFTFGNYGEPKYGMTAIEYYTMQVKSVMFNDVFLAFEGLGKQMNNPEVFERINEKMSMLGPAVGRFTSEILNPIIIRTIGILWRKGKLPPPPDEMIEDPSYEIDFVGQLAQAQKRSELNSFTTALTMTGQMAQFNPNILDKVNMDKAVDEIWDITGASIKLLRDDGEVDEIRQQKAQEAAAMQQAALAESMAGTLETASKVDKNIADAKQTIQSK